MTGLHLGPTMLSDLDWVVSVEYDPANFLFITLWDRTQHEGGVRFPDSVALSSRRRHRAQALYLSEVFVEEGRRRESYVNLIPTVDSDTHESGLRCGAN